MVKTYSYDNRYQLITAEGTHQGFDKQHKYNLAMQYGATGKILRKTQSNQWRKMNSVLNHIGKIKIRLHRKNKGEYLLHSIFVLK